MPDTKNLLQFLKASQVCRMLHIHRSTLWQLVERGGFLAAIRVSPRPTLFSLTEVLEYIGRQLETRREAESRYADVQQVIETPDGGNPANSADLAALTTDHLRHLANSITSGNTSDWRQYWNFPSGQEPTPKDENLCRDALLSDLRLRLPEDVDAQPEGVYAADRRADIRVSYKGFNVPVEAKRSMSRDLWTAIGTQLMAKYAIDPGATGHGIYLVFWFGRKHCQKPPEGEKPTTPQQLEERLQRSLTLEEARKIDVIVVDVSDQKRADESV